MSGGDEDISVCSHKKRVLEVCLAYQQVLEDGAIFIVEKMDQ